MKNMQPSDWFRLGAGLPVLNLGLITFGTPNDEVDSPAPPGQSDAPPWDEDEQPAPAAPVAPPPPVAVAEVPIGKDPDGNLVTLDDGGRTQGLYVIGANGTGKSTLIELLIRHDLETGRGLCVLDPHGDLSNAALVAVPEHRRGDVRVLDVLDSTHPFGLNLYECADPTDPVQVQDTVSLVMRVFTKVFGDPVTGELGVLVAQYLRHSAYLLVTNPPLAMTEVAQVVLDADFRAGLLERAPQETRTFWAWHDKLSERDRTENLQTVLNRVQPFTANHYVRGIVGQAKSTVNFRQAMDEGQILIVKLAARYEDLTSLIGTLIVGRILTEALGRADTPRENRRPFSLYADEYQRFATPDFRQLLSEVRKYNVATTIAHQFLAQLDRENQGAARQAGTIVVFRVNGEDPERLATEFDATPPPGEVVGTRPVLVVSKNPLVPLCQYGHPHPDVQAFLKAHPSVSSDERTSFSINKSMAATMEAGRVDDTAIQEQLARLRSIRDTEKYDRRETYWNQKIKVLEDALTILPILVVEPLQVQTGVQEPIYGNPRTYADMVNERASELANLPNYTARVKVRGGVTPFEARVSIARPREQRLSDPEALLVASRQLIGRPRQEVEEEIASRIPEKPSPKGRRRRELPDD